MCPGGNCRCTSTTNARVLSRSAPRPTPSPRPVAVEGESGRDTAGALHSRLARSAAASTRPNWASMARARPATPPTQGGSLAWLGAGPRITLSAAWYALVQLARAAECRPALLCVSTRCQRHSLLHSHSPGISSPAIDPVRGGAERRRATPSKAGHPARWRSHAARPVRGLRRSWLRSTGLRHSWALIGRIFGHTRVPIATDPVGSPSLRTSVQGARSSLYLETTVLQSGDDIRWPLAPEPYPGPPSSRLRRVAVHMPVAWLPAPPPDVSQVGPHLRAVLACRDLDRSSEVAIRLLRMRRAIAHCRPAQPRHPFPLGRIQCGPAAVARFASRNGTPPARLVHPRPWPEPPPLPSEPCRAPARRGAWSCSEIADESG